MATSLANCIQCVVILVGICLAVGCNRGERAGTQLLHPVLRPAQRLVPARYFSDSKAIELCTAIQKGQFESIEAMLDKGVEVNALGKDNVTPLLWATLTGDVDTFQHLIQRGANPNIRLTGDLAEARLIRSGDSVTTIVAQDRTSERFEWVMKHGGDATITAHDGEPLLFAITRGAGPEAEHRASIALSAGADARAIYQGSTLPIEAVTWYGQYRLAKFYLERGADKDVYLRDELPRLAHIVLSRAKREGMPPGSQALIDYLRAAGDDLVQAKTDNERWSNLSFYPPEVVGKKIAEDVKARKERELAAKGIQNNPPGVANGLKEAQNRP